MSVAENIANMIMCRSGEHCLFRSFGLGGVVDSPNRITRNSLQIEINRWFPGVIAESVNIKKATLDGNFEYKIKLRGE